MRSFKGLLTIIYSPGIESLVDSRGFPIILADDEIAICIGAALEQVTSLDSQEFPMNASSVPVSPVISTLTSSALNSLSNIPTLQRKICKSTKYAINSITFASYSLVYEVRGNNQAVLDSHRFLGDSTLVNKANNIINYYHKPLTLEEFYMNYDVTESPNLTSILNSSTTDESFSNDTVNAATIPIPDTTSDMYHSSVLVTAEVTTAAAAIITVDTSEVHNDIDLCAICLDPMNTRGGISLIIPGCCGKTFHQNFISRLNSCPNCRHNICSQLIESPQQYSDSSWLSDQLVNIRHYLENAAAQLESTHTATRR